VRAPLARYRPQSQGIAGRFIEILEPWLADREWQTLLAQFLANYYGHPRQGRELRGLPPNEYAARKLTI
jgi:hypothetical protein